MAPTCEKNVQIKLTPKNFLLIIFNVLYIEVNATRKTTKPIYYYIGTRLGQILHTMLCMQCSSLNHHLFRKNIANSPFCQFGATETTAHFLLHFPRHNATRLRYIHTINLPINLNTDLLLFVSTDLTNTLNTDIFLNVQKFIISSKRFTS